MLEAPRPETSPIAVSVIPEGREEVADIRGAQLAPGGSLLGCLLPGTPPGGHLLPGTPPGGRLLLWDPADRGAPPAAVDASCTEFSWEEQSVPGRGGVSRLLAVGAQWDLKLLEVEVEPSAAVALLCVSGCSADVLLQAVRQQDHSVFQLQSLRLLSFAAGRSCVLLNGDWLLQLQWLQAEAEPQILTCCSIQPAEGDRDTAVSHCVSRGTLFTLSAAGVMSVFSISDGLLLASVDIPLYLSSDLEEDDAVSSSPISSSSSSSSFCLLQVSADLSTAVAVTRSHAAVAVDLDRYFRMCPDHLICAVPPPPPDLGTLRDQDDVSSCSLAALGSTFSTDRSWEAHLASMYSRAQQAPPPSSSSSPSSSQPAGRPWSSSLPPLESHQAPPPACSRVPRGGATISFSVPESSAPCLLAVSEFSALLTFVSPGNRLTTVASWDFASGSVSLHQEQEEEAAPLLRCGERQHRLLLKKAGVFQVLFSVSQQDLLSSLMLFGSAATVDAVCHLNSWGRCSVPIHALQAGLKNRQLDTVDFYLKSKENLLTPAPASGEQPTAATPSLSDCVQELCPALDLLCSAVRDSNSEAQSRQFSEQLLNFTLNFVNTQIRSVLSSSHYEDAGVRSCVDVLDRYVTELRSYMKRYPWPAGGDVSSTDSAAPAQEEALEDEWEELPTEELVHQSILTNQIPRAQAVLRRRSRPEQHLSALRREGLRQVFSRLQQRDVQTAAALLVNMGFSVKKQLHSFCLYTDDKHLREFVVEELSRRSYFSEEEMQSVMFIRQMEKLGSVFPSRRPADATGLRVLQMVPREPGGGAEEVLGELVGQRRSEKEAGLWQKVRLDWVRNWDQSCQTGVLLSRLQHTELSSCDPAVLWRYLTALHDQHRVVDWIQNQEAAGAPLWPELVPELVNNNTLCSTYMRENILDLLARRGRFVPEELEDLEKLLWRLAQGGGAMASSPPVPQHRSALGLDLHGLVITFCLDRGLKYLLYTYLEHYRLTPRNCPVLTNQSLSESQPWFEMMVKIQEITRDLSDPRLLFQACLTSAQVLLPGSQASLSSLLLEGHSLLALAAIAFAPGGIDQVGVQGSEGSGRTVDPQLLKMALAPHSKLKAALFPPGPRGHSPSSDISVYHLLQALLPLDPSRLFGWQAANSLNSTETSELPHFSSPHLVEQFSLVENLDFLFYLRHGRPSFAFATFLVQQLSSRSDATLLWKQAQQQVHRFALRSFDVPSVASAAVCFCELLGVCSLRLRVELRAMITILQHWSLHNTHTAPTHRLHTLGVKLAEAEPGAAQQLIGYLEAAVADSVEQRGVGRSSYEASQEWAVPVQFCQLHGLALSSVYPAHCAQDGQFVHFLLFVELHSFPPQQVRSLVAGFGPALQAHLSLAFQELQLHRQRRSSGSEEQPQGGSRQTASGGPEPLRELFQVLLQSQEEAWPGRFLLHEALVQRCPLLAVLASCQQGAELLPCLCAWVLTSVNDVTLSEATAHLLEAPQHHEWTLHDLSIIWRTLLGRGHVRPLLRGFALFQRDCPLVLVLRMFELCCDYRNFSEAKVKLLDFQRTLITLRNSGPAPPGGLPLQWVESQASVLLLTMLQRCSSQYDLHRLLQLLADVDKLLKSNGPDFRKLSRLSQLLQGSDVSLSPRLLQCSSASVQQEEFQAAVDALQARGRYTQARKVALLADLPVHHLLLSQLLQEMNSQKSKTTWRRLETRVTFWRTCQEQLKSDSTDPGSASCFFLSQAEASGSSAAAEVQTELLDVQERCLLLGLAAHWLSQLSPPPIHQLESMEKKLWISRVRQHVLAVAMEQESVFNLPPPAVAPEMNKYEVLMKEFSFSNISALNTETCLRLDGLPGRSEEQEEQQEEEEQQEQEQQEEQQEEQEEEQEEQEEEQEEQEEQEDQQEELNINSEERRVLASLIGQLLDDGSIHEASRVCRYFCLHHPDVWVVLRCRGLASGELSPAPQEEESEAPARRSITPSSSFGSLSLAMTPPPEDEVAVQLQRLVDQCCHGNNYCKQVLSLYQLSKELQSSFSQICLQEPGSVLELLLQSDQPERFRKAQAFIRAQGLSTDTVAELVSSAVAQALLGSAHDLHTEKQVFRPSEGRDSLLQLIKLCDDPNLVGIKLLENINVVPLRDLSCIVDLLIAAHDCFSLTCNMEGIVRVLQAARHLSHAYLAPGEHYGLLVRLLTGVGRYDEMTYVFDLLHQNHRFEMLLRKKVDMDRGQSSSLKTALLDYIRRCLPADSEKHNMVALCFSMRREIGENHEMAARTQLKIIESQEWVVTPDLKSSLVKVLGLLKDAAESFSKDSCVRQATLCVHTAKLVALQLHFLNQGSDVRVINLRPAVLLNTLVQLPRCYQVFVVSEAYGVGPDWAELLFQKVILKGDFVYLEELKRHRPLTSSLFEDIFKKLDGAPSSVTPHVKRLLTHCEDVYSHYRLAYQQNLEHVTKTMLQDAETSNYLNDRLAS